MAQEQWNAVDRYLAGLFVGRDEALESALRANTAAGLPAIDVSPCQGKLLMLLAQTAGAHRILEIGTLGGYSTICLARGLRDGGRLITLESEPRHAEVALGNIRRAGLADRVDLRLGRAIDTLPRLVDEGAGPFDLIFIDADKQGYPDYLGWSLKLARAGGLIIADNVVRGGAVIDERSTDPGVQGIRRFNELLARHPRLSATAIQTVGSKGYDGFAVARVLDES